MKEKIKNFLLKIKKYFTEKFICSRIKLILFALLCIIITAFFNLITFTAKECCFNETHTEQIEEIPQTESIRIERDIKGSNGVSGSPIISNSYIDYIYFNTELSFDVVVAICQDIYDKYSLGGVVDLLEYDNKTLTIAYIGHSPSFTWYIGDFNSPTIYFANNLNAGYSNFIGWNSSLNGRVSVNSTIISNIDLLPYSILFSSQPFETCSTPTLENAPSSLVNTIPSNAVITLPSNLGTKVYDSGSGLTMTDGGNEYNTFGFQIYYDSTIHTSETELYQFTIDGVTYNVEPNVYRYYLNDVKVVIYTLWNNTPIYYVFDNLLMGGNWPFTLDYESRFAYTDLSNVFASSVYIENTYSDYVHINIEFGYYMSLNRSGDIEYLIDTEETGIEALIYSTTHSGNYGDKGFDLDIIPQLDVNYSKMGQSQTDNMYSTIVHGGTINSVWSNAYNKGLNVGNASGYTNGYNDGVETGKTLQNPINPIMDFISDGASVISNVFSFEILPNISLGTMLLFPLAIALIWFVIKLFMGG